MGQYGACDFSELKRFAEKLKRLEGKRTQEFFESAAKELAARLLTLAIERTPVGQYPAGSGMTGGTLRRGWVSKTQEEAADGTGANPGIKEISSLMDSAQIKRSGGGYIIEVINPVEYAGYVESGHRTANHKGWVRGQFMLAISEQELRKTAPKLLEKKLERFLRECMK